MENKVIAILDGMTKLLTEKGWTQGALARDKDGGVRWTDSHLETACSFCLRGALVVASRQHGTQAQMSARSRLEMALGVHGDTVSFNDAPGRTREEVLDLIERAKKLEVARDG